MKKIFFATLVLSFMSSSLMAEEYTMERARQYAIDVCVRNQSLSECQDTLISLKLELEKLREEAAGKKQTKSKTNKKRQKKYCAPDNPYC